MRLFGLRDSRQDTMLEALWLTGAAAKMQGMLRRRLLCEEEKPLLLQLLGLCLGADHAVHAALVEALFKVKIFSENAMGALTDVTLVADPR